jgi:hypothetical protein
MSYFCKDTNLKLLKLANVKQNYNIRINTSHAKKKLFPTSQKTLTFSITRTCRLHK